MPDVTAIFGLNGSGKTSLLKILNSALTNDSLSLTRVPFTTAHVKLRQEGKEFDCFITKDDVTESEILLDEMVSRLQNESLAPRIEQDRIRRFAKKRVGSGWKFESSDGPEDGGFQFSHRYLPTSRLTTITDRQRVNASDLTEEGYDAAFARKIEALWRDYAQQELIEERAIQQEGLAEIFNSVLNRSTDGDSDNPPGNADDAYRALTKFFQDQKIQVKATKSRFVKNYRLDPLLRNVVSLITDVERRVAEAHAPSRKIESLVSDLYTGGKKVSLESRSIIVTGLDDSRIPIALLSSGEKQVLYILLETLAARGDVIVIDEPELSMHVDWQNALIDSMRTVNSEAQIILATHSPEVLAGVPDRCIKEL